jgi:hypothetical protein
MSQRTLSPRRLNPFAFPSETDVRFVLLIVAAVALTWRFGSMVTVVLTPALGLPERTMPPSFESINDLSAVVDHTLNDIGLLLQQICIPLLFVAAMLSLAYVLFRLTPGRIRRHLGLKPLERAQHAGFAAEVGALSRRAGVYPPPAIELRAGPRSTTGLAFGTPGHYHLGLGNGLPLLLRKAPLLCRAILLHELAHIANRDVSRTYFTQALWTPVMGLAFLPVIASVVMSLWTIAAGLFQGKFSLGTIALNAVTTGLLVLQAGLMLLFLYAVRASYLRTREIYADWRAATWGAEAPLMNILARNKSTEPRRRIFSLHPAPEDRLAVLTDPASLFRIPLDLVFFVGVLLSMVLDGIQFFVWKLGNLLLDVGGLVIVGTGGLLEVVIPRAPSDAWIILFEIIAVLAITLIPTGGILVVYWFALRLITGTLGVEVQRQSLALLTSGKSVWSGGGRLVLIALVGGLGLAAGYIIGPLSPSVTFAFFALGLVLLIGWVVMVAGLLWLWLIFGHVCSARLFGRHLSANVPRWKRRTLNFAMTLLLLILFAPAIMAHMEITNLVLAIEPMISPVLIGVTLFAGLGLYPIIFGVTWLLIEGGYLIRSPHCPRCRCALKRSVRAGQRCEHCNYELASWLYVVPAAPLE